MPKDIHPLDQIELYKQTGELVYSTLTRKFFEQHNCPMTTGESRFTGKIAK